MYPAKTRVLVAGAGYLGMAFAKLMQESEVVIARRSEVKDSPFPVFRCDFTQAESLRSLPDFDLVYYSVAADSATTEAYENAYFLGLKNLVDHFKTRGQQPAFFYSSSTSVYAAKEGEICLEDSPLVTNGLSVSMIRGEDYLLKSGLKASVLRYGGLYGPSRISFLARIKDRKEALTPGHPSFMNRIHQQDAVRMVEFLYQNGAEGIFNGVDLEPSVRDDVILYLSAALGIPREEISISHEQLSRGHKRVLSDKIQKLGFRHDFPSYREGYQAQLSEV